MRKGLVLDANILIRAVLGVRVRTLLERYEKICEFYGPDVCFLEARRYLPQIVGNRASILDRRWPYSMKSFAWCNR